MTLVLVIDDEPQILRALRINLTVRGYQVITASTGAGALRAAAEHPPDVVILDLGLPDMSGIDVLGGLRGWLTAPVIVFGAYRFVGQGPGPRCGRRRLRDETVWNGRVSGSAARSGTA